MTLSVSLSLYGSFEPSASDMLSELSAVPVLVPEGCVMLGGVDCCQKALSVFETASTNYFKGTPGFLLL